MNYATKLKEIKKESNNKLEKKVINILLSRKNDYECITSYMKEICDHGCSSGIVGELIYYNDTLAFFTKYKNEINLLLKNSMDDLGIYNLKEFFGKNYDDSDPLLSETHNKNLLAWYAMEETTRQLFYKMNIEY
jgi:hypothetical protein